MGLVDGQFGHGAIPTEVLVLPHYVGAGVFDWNVGFDIRNVLGGEIFKKNQWSSSSCVGQGSSYYEWVLQVIEMMKKYGENLAQLRVNHPDEVNEISARAIYSQISLGLGQGARFADAMTLVTTWGALFESDVPSYYDGTSKHMTDENFMFDRSWETPQLDARAKILVGKNKNVLPIVDMDNFALAIVNNSGLVGGVIGSNGHGWSTTESPTPPSPGEDTWGHCLFYGAAGTDAQGKFIATPNSWGNFLNASDWFPGAPIGYGWQKLRENYFNSQYQFNPWTYTDIPNDTPVFKHTFLVNLGFGANNPTQEVIALQTALFLEGTWTDSELNTLEKIKTFGGYFGSTTLSEVKTFQTKYHLPSTGFVGPMTRQVLNKLYS